MKNRLIELCTNFVSSCWNDPALLKSFAVSSVVGVCCSNQELPIQVGACILSGAGAYFTQKKVIPAVQHTLTDMTNELWSNSAAKSLLGR